jgi:hypothetical protein
VAKEAGFSLHAGVSTEAHQRDKLERLCRHVTRPQGQLCAALSVYGFASWEAIALGCCCQSTLYTGPLAVIGTIVVLDQSD